MHWHPKINVSGSHTHTQNPFFIPKNPPKLGFMSMGLGLKRIPNLGFGCRFMARVWGLTIKIFKETQKIQMKNFTDLLKSNSGIFFCLD